MIYPAFIFKKKQLVNFILLLFLSGCGIWTDFTTYFNAYFNASSAFDDGYEIVLTTKRDLFIYKEPALQSTAKTKFDAVIDKCSKILQFASESSYFDDALFLIGRAFYYEQDYLKALRKFQELDILPDSDLHLQNKLWIGKTELQLRNFDKGYQILDEVKEEAAKADEPEILEEAFRSQIGYLIFREQYINSITLCRDLINATESQELKAQVALQIGKMYKILEDYPNADKAFTEVSEYSPDFQTEFESVFESAKIKRDLGNIDESLVLLEDMRNENKFSDNWDLVDIEIGKIFYDRSEYEPAMEKFTYVDTAFVQNPTSGIASYYRAMIWENYYRDFDSALVFYDKAKVSKAENKYKDIAKNKSENIIKYFDLVKELFNQEKKLLYVLDPEAFIQDSLDYEAFKDRDSSLTEEEKLELTTTEQQPTQTQTQPRTPAQTQYQQEEDIPLDSLNQKINKITVQPVRPTISADSLKFLSAKAALALGNHFFTELEFTDSAYFYYIKIISEYDSTSLVAKAYYSLGSYYQAINDSVKADSMFQIVYKNYGEDPISIEAAKKLKIAVAVEEDPANHFYIEAENNLFNKEYDKALTGFFEIYQKYPKSLLAPKALYAAGWILENEFNLPDSAAAVYDTLATKFISTEYAKTVKPKVAVWKDDLKKQLARQDSIKKAIQDSITNAQIAADSLKNSDMDIDSLQVKSTIERQNEIIDSVKSQISDDRAPADSTQNTPPEQKNKIDTSAMQKMTPEQRRRYIDSLKTLQTEQPRTSDSVKTVNKDANNFQNRNTNNSRTSTLDSTKSRIPKELTLPDSSTNTQLQQNKIDSTAVQKLIPEHKRPNIDSLKVEQPKRARTEDSVKTVDEAEKNVQVKEKVDSQTSTLDSILELISKERTLPDSSKNTQPQQNKTDGIDLQKMTPTQKRHYIDSLKATMNEKPQTKDTTLVKELLESPKN
ncbi:MAG: hypothetical protein V1720_13835 [bacterium]